MKNLYCAFLLVIIFTSCSTPTPNEAVASASDSIIVRVINPEFFITEYDTIKNGRDLLWNFSLYQFGDGTQWRKWVDLNPILQEPGRVWKDSSTNRWIALVKKGEVLKNPQPVYFTAPTKDIVTYNKVEVVKTTAYWPVLLAIFIVGSLIVFLLTRRNQIKELREKEKDLRENEEAISHLKFEMKKMENQLPVKAPAIADEKWLAENNPVGNPIPLPNQEDEGQSTIQAIERAIGKKPDLIVTAKVWTKENATQMEFSHGRKSSTGLDGVVVYLGWNWDIEKKRWVEAGMIAGPCSNGFEANPGSVKKGEIFSKIDIVTKNQHPVIFIGDNVPKMILYPKLVRLLVLQYHENNITDLRTRTGTLVEIPEGLKPGLN